MRNSTALIFTALILFVFISCQKNLPDKKSEEIKKEADNLLFGRADNSGCGSVVYREVAEYDNDIDTLNLRKDSSVLYLIPKEDGSVLKFIISHLTITDLRSPIFL